MSTELDFFEDGPDDSEPQIQVDDSFDLRPDLTELGIEEIERGVCEDTFENRKIVRQAKLRYQPLYDQFGRGTGLINVFTVDALIERRIISLAEKRPLMVEPDNRNSDYLTGLDLILDDRAVALTPPWVVGATRKWITEQEAGRKPGKRPAPLPKRCRVVKTDSIRCMLWTSGLLTDDGMCRVHLKQARRTSDDIERARKKLVQAAPYAVDVLEELMDGAESEPVRLKASTEILDRAGVRGGQDFTVDVDVTDNRSATQIVVDRLARLAAGAETVRAMVEREQTGANGETVEIIEAEIMDDELPTEEEQ